MKVYLGKYKKDYSPRKIEVRIDKWDVWSLDHTLALIIHPALIKIRESKHGAPLVDDSDVPDELKSTNSSPKEHEWDIDDFFFDRWNWVIDEMIWAFSEILNESEDVKSTDEVEAYMIRMDRAFMLFGKYFRNLWT